MHNHFCFLYYWLRQVFQAADHIRKEFPICLAVIILSSMPLILEAVPPAPSAAQRIPPARRTAVSALLSIQKERIFIEIHPDFFEIRIPHIPLTVFIQRIKVTGVHRSVRLHHILLAAAPVHGARFRGLPSQDFHIILKRPDIDARPLLQILKPQIEQCLQGFRIELRRQGVYLFPSDPGRG